MKRIILIAHTTILISCFALSNAHGASVGIGAQIWYAWWQPAWGSNDYTADPTITVKQSSNLRDPDPAFMGGPLLSVGWLDRWNFSLAGAYGKYKTWGIRQPATNLMVFEYVDIKKYDVDNAFSYLLNRYFKIFVGLKLQGYDYYKKLYQIASGVYRWEQYKHTTYTSYGPGVGIGFSLPLSERLFLLWNNNALLLFASEKTHLIRYNLEAPQSIVHYSYEGKARLYGVNSIISFGYLIPDSHVTITTGFRYQVLYYKQKKSDVGEYYFDGKTDKFYGIVVSAIYSFDV